MRVYSGDKVDAICTYLGVTPEDIQVFSDNSITLDEHSPKYEYYVTKGRRKYDERVARINGFNIYRREC